MVCWLGVVVTVLLRPRNPPRGYFVTFFSIEGAAGLASLAIALLIVAYQLRARKERRSGYTWQPNFLNLDEIDPVTGVVIREAGEPLLSGIERSDRVKRAREWAAQHPIAG
jgi:hypothetical protein